MRGFLRSTWLRLSAAFLLGVLAGLIIPSFIGAGGIEAAREAKDQLVKRLGWIVVALGVPILIIEYKLWRAAADSRKCRQKDFTEMLDGLEYELRAHAQLAESLAGNPDNPALWGRHFPSQFLEQACGQYAPRIATANSLILDLLRDEIEDGRQLDLLTQQLANLDSRGDMSVGVGKARSRLLASIKEGAKRASARAEEVFDHLDRVRSRKVPECDGEQDSS